MPETKTTSAKGRQAGDYDPPILAEPKGGPIPGGAVRSALRHLPGKHNQLSHAHGGGSGASVDGDKGRPRPRTVKVRTQDGSIHLSQQSGRLTIRIPFDGSDDEDDDRGLRDSLELDASTAAEFAEELQLLEEAATDYNRRVKKLWDAAVAINPEGGGDGDTDPASKKAWEAVAELAGDGQRIAGGQLDAEDGSELHYELRMGDEPGEMDLLVGIRPPGADDDWDLHETAADGPGAFLTWSQLKKLRREVDGLLADDGADARSGNQLKQYWLHGEGAAKWVTWTQLYNHLKKHLPAEQAKRVAAQWFHDRYGYWPGHQKGDNPTGPG